METGNFTPKSFWERPEGTTGMIIGVLLALGLGWATITYLLPFLILAFTNTILTVGLGAIAFALLWALLDRRNWALAWYGYKGIMRWMTGWIIEIDPIGILKSYAEDLRSSLENMSTRISDLRAEMRKLKEIIEKNSNQAGEALDMARRAEQAKKQNVYVLKSRQAGRLTNSNKTLQQIHNKMEMSLRVLQKMYESSELLIQDIEGEIVVKSSEREAIRASHSAFRSAMKVIQGDKDKRVIFDETLEYLADDYGRKLGEIEHFVAVSGTFLDSLDLQNGTYEEEAMKMLEAWEQQGDSLLLGNEKQALLLESPREEKEPITAYAKLLK